MTCRFVFLMLGSVCISTIFVSVCVIPVVLLSVNYLSVQFLFLFSVSLLHYLFLFFVGVCLCLSLFLCLSFYPSLFPSAACLILSLFSVYLLAFELASVSYMPFVIFVSCYSFSYNNQKILSKIYVWNCKTPISVLLI